MKRDCGGLPHPRALVTLSRRVCGPFGTVVDSVLSDDRPTLGTDRFPAFRIDFDVGITVGTRLLSWWCELHVYYGGSRLIGPRTVSVRQPRY